MSNEFELNGNTYRVGKLNARQQFHVSRRLLPLFSSIKGVGTKDAAKDLAVSIGDDGDVSMKKAIDFASLLEPLFEEVSKLPDEEVDYVLNTCLSVVSRKQGDGWAPVFHTVTKTVMFSDIDDMVPMLNITMKVLEANLANFTKGLPA